MSTVPGTVFAVDSVASWDSDNDIIIPDISNDTHKNVSVTSCDVYVAIDDDTCVGYEVYIDGVYQFTEGQGTTPDGFCSFSVTAGTHTLEIQKNGCSATKTYNFLCGVSYTWVSMPDYWCDCGGSDCDNPPAANFDKSSYDEGDTVQITVSTTHSSVYYEITDCSGTVRETGYTSGGTISYTIPDGSTSSCCYWTICFYWGEGDNPVGPLGAAGNINVESYQCSKCNTFYVCPETPCEVSVAIDDDTCVGYEVYIDRVYQFTEGQGTTPDGFCSFSVTEGTHTLEIQKDGCSASKTYNFRCGVSYTWVSMPDYWCECNKRCPSDVSFTGTATTDELTGWVCYGTYYCDVIVDKIISDPDNSIDVGSEYTVGYGSNPKHIKSGDKIEVDGSYYHNCGPLNQMGRICGNVNKILPDLIIQDISWSPSSPEQGDTVTFTVKIKNQGSGSAGTSTVKYYIDDSYVTSDSVSGLSAGSTSTQSFMWTAYTCGNTVVKAVADANSAVSESNEGNNERTETVSITCNKPDLVIQDISWDKSSPKQGDTITFTVKVKNQGSESAGTSAVKYYIDGSYVTSDSVPSLSAGSTSTQTFTWTAAKCGNVQVNAVADANNAVSESNEWNNERTETVSITCNKPDLVIQDISWNPANPEQGDTVTYTVKIKNQGSGSAGTSTVKYYIDGSYVTSDSVPSLSAGSASTQTFTWTATKCGNVQVKAVADANSAVSASNEWNNERTETVSVACPKEIKFNGTLTGQNWPMGFGAYYFKVDKLLEGSIPVGDDIRVMVYTSAYPDPLNNYDRLNTGDKAEVYAEFEEDIGKQYDSWVEREVWAADITGNEKYYVKKVEKQAFDPAVDGYRFSNTEITFKSRKLIIAEGLIILNMATLVSPYNWLKMPYFEWALFTSFRGSCAGVSAMSALYYVDFSEKPALLRDTNTYDMPLSNEVLDNIAHSHAMQLIYNSRPCFSHNVDEEKEFNQIKTDIDEHGVALISLGQDTLLFWATWPHMVVGYDYEYNGRIAAVRIYDSNYPGRKDRSIAFDFDDNIIGYSSISDAYKYAAAANINVIASEHLLRENIDNFRVLFRGDFFNLLTFHCPVNVTITDQYGRIISDDGTDEISDADMLITEDTKIFYLPADLTYTTEIDAYDTGAFNFTRLSPIGNDISITKFENIQITSSTKASVDIEPGVTDYTMSIDYNGDGTTDEVKSPDVSETIIAPQNENIFDTRASANPYQSIAGTHTGTIAPTQDIPMQKLYTYPCAGTGGHTESVRIYGNDVEESASWTGYAEDGDIITFDSSFTLEEGKTYNYVIETGSYPQIHHTAALQTENGWLNCTKFTDANGKEYDDWIPAIRLGT